MESIKTSSIQINKPTGSFDFCMIFQPTNFPIPSPNLYITLFRKLKCFKKLYKFKGTFLDYLICIYKFLIYI